MTNLPSRRPHPIAGSPADRLHPSRRQGGPRRCQCHHWYHQYRLSACDTGKPSYLTSFATHVLSFAFFLSPLLRALTFSHLSFFCLLSCLPCPAVVVVSGAGVNFDVQSSAERSTDQWTTFSIWTQGPQGERKDKQRIYRGTLEQHLKHPQRAVVRSTREANGRRGGGGGGRRGRRLEGETGDGFEVGDAVRDEGHGREVRRM